MSWYSFKPYVSVAERRRIGEQTVRKLAKQGKVLSPVRPEGRKIATTFWGKAWCDNLESYSDYANRLPRGRSYLTNGSVIDLQISAGKINAMVQGSDLYTIEIKIDALNPTRWAQFKKAAAGKVTNLLDLLQGKLSKEILADITAKGAGLFPAPKEIHLDCSCPDYADMCKHVAAVLYGVGTRLDSKPELFFTLRGVDMQELISAASANAVVPLASKTKPSALADADLSELFGVEIEDGAGAGTGTAKGKRKPSAKKTKPKPKARKPAGRARSKTRN
jgi:uncharacterized Zn finger protein